MAATNRFQECSDYMNEEPTLLSRADWDNTFPVMASTWNVDLIYEVGAAFGQEALTDGQSGWYAPGMNIHRSPFAGRNLKYFSEDPLLTGKLAAAMISGAGDQGLYCFAKHFAVNDQETRRSKDAGNHPEKYKQKTSGK